MTDRQRLVLGFIVKHRDEHGFSPTIREIGQHLGIKSTNGVNDHLRALAKRGLIQLGDGKSRAIVVLDASPIDVERVQLTDTEALDRIAATLDGGLGSTDDRCDEIARILRLTGRAAPDVADLTARRA